MTIPVLSRRTFSISLSLSLFLLLIQGSARAQTDFATATATQGQLSGVKVLFDLGHDNPAFLDPTDPYVPVPPSGVDKAYDLGPWRDLLVAAGATVDKLEDGTITAQLLAGYDVFVSVQPQKSFSSAEGTALRSFVAQGKGVLALGEGYNTDYPYDDSWYGPLRGLMMQYGMELRQEQLQVNWPASEIVIDPGWANLIGGDLHLTELQSIATVDGGEGLIFFDSPYNPNPGNRTPLLASAAYEQGLVILVGDTTLPRSP